MVVYCMLLPFLPLQCAFGTAPRLHLNIAQTITRKKTQRVLHAANHSLGSGGWSLVHRVAYTAPHRKCPARQILTFYPKRPGNVSFSGPKPGSPRHASPSQSAPTKKTTSCPGEYPFAPGGHVNPTVNTNRTWTGRMGCKFQIATNSLGHQNNFYTKHPLHQNSFTPNTNGSNLHPLLPRAPAIFPKVFPRFATHKPSAV